MYKEMKRFAVTGLAAACAVGMMAAPVYAGEFGDRLIENESELYRFKIDAIVIHKDNRDRFKRAVKLQTKIRDNDKQFEYGNTESIVKYVKEKLINKFTHHELNCICYGSFRHPIVYMVFVCDRNQFNANGNGM